MAGSKKPSAIVAKKPVSVWKKPVKLQSLKFVSALGRAIYDGATSDWKNLGKDAQEAIEAAGLSNEPDELLWKLVLRALAGGVIALIDDTRPFPPDATAPDEARLTEGLNRALGETALTLDRSFFERPEDLAILGTLSAPLADWLHAHGASEADARSMTLRLPSYFTYALHQEWYERATEYAPLLQALDTPFAKAGERERAWERYAARLQRQINEPMLGEAFGVVHVYVPLRGYYEQEEEEGSAQGKHRPNVAVKSIRHVINVDDELDAWVSAPGKDVLAVRVIAGGPGSGKSSVAKMFAARQSAKGRRVLYVPLHLIDPEGDIESAVGRFVKQQDILPANPLEGEKHLILLLDGLDELAMQGKAAAEVTRKLIEEVRRLVENRNRDGVRLQVLLGGRDIVVQMSRSELRKPGQVIHLLPYHVRMKEEEKEAYRDPQKLLRVDQRDVWWQNYGAAKGKTYKAMPRELRRDDLDEITAQPLLGCLVALQHDIGKTDFSKQEALNRNIIYHDLICAVHERTYAGRRHPGVRGLELHDFLALLEEVGLSTWHGDGRSTTVTAIQKLCTRSGLDRLLDRFEEGAASGATRLLTAFYFRQQGHRTSGDKTFEFTHKSFGEYLTARRIVRAIERMHEEMEARRLRPGRGWSEGQALKHWAEVCGPSAVDLYIRAFIVGEMREKENVDVGHFQKMLAHLIGHMLEHGMPMEELNPRPSYADEARQARNAEEALLACLYACAARTEELSKVRWPEPTSAGAWLRRLQGQRTDETNGVALMSLAWLDLGGQTLDFFDAYCANVGYADLTGVSMNGICLAISDLRFANLADANLNDANLTFANLTFANLKGANLKGADLKGADLKGADLTDANLTRANLKGATLDGTNLMGANLAGADLTDANLTDANLVGTDLSGANLSGANLSGTDLSGANLRGAKLTGAGLRGAKLIRTILPEDMDAEAPRRAARR